MTSEVARRPPFSIQQLRSTGQPRSIGRTAAALMHVVRRIILGIAHRRTLTRLDELDDRMLADIGLRRSDLEIARSVPLYQDPLARCGLPHVVSRLRSSQAEAASPRQRAAAFEKPTSRRLWWIVET
jgi:uncharacterized protein YjiS (DUF1127 family)